MDTPIDITTIDEFIEGIVKQYLLRSLLNTRLNNKSKGL